MPLGPNALTNTENVDHHHGRIQVRVFNHEISLSYYSSAYTICSLPTQKSSSVSQKPSSDAATSEISQRGGCSTDQHHDSNQIMARVRQLETQLGMGSGNREKVRTKPSCVQLLMY